MTPHEHRALDWLNTVDFRRAWHSIARHCLDAARLDLRTPHAGECLRIARIAIRRAQEARRAKAAA